MVCACVRVCVVRNCCSPSGFCDREWQLRVRLRVCVCVSVLSAYPSVFLFVVGVSFLSYDSYSLLATLGSHNRFGSSFSLGVVNLIAIYRSLGW